MAQPFILGIQERIPASALRPTTELYNLVGHNTGNLAFHHAVSSLLGGNIPAISWYAPPASIDARGEIGVMPCANQVGPHADYSSLATSFSDLSCKLVAIGLGAQGDLDCNDLPLVPPGTLRWIEEIAKRSPKGRPNISVRGPYSHRVLEHHGFGAQALVLGCPSLFLNPDPQLGQRIEERIRSGGLYHVAVAGGHHLWKHLSQLETSLTRLMAASGGSYITQSPEQMVALGRGDLAELNDVDLAELRDFVAPELSREEFQQWAVRYARTFFDISAWMEYLRRFDFIIGLRIHGVMLALQAGIPGLCIAHDSRTRELCETLKVPFVMASDVAGGISREALPELFRFDGAAFDANRRLLGARMATFMKDNDLPLARSFAPLFSVSVPALSPRLAAS